MEYCSGQLEVPSIVQGTRNRGRSRARKINEVREETKKQNIFLAFSSVIIAGCRLRVAAELGNVLKYIETCSTPWLI